MVARRVLTFKIKGKTDSYPLKMLQGDLILAEVKQKLASYSGPVVRESIMAFLHPPSSVIESSLDVSKVEH